jgi:hypothetical protein
VPKRSSIGLKGGFHTTEKAEEYLFVCYSIRFVTATHAIPDREQKNQIILARALLDLAR